MSDAESAAGFALPRTALFMRGDHQGHLARIDSSEAEAVIVDFEDAVAATRKETARQFFAEAMAAKPARERIWVRLSTGDPHARACRADLEVVVREEVEAIVIPKTEGTRELAELSSLVAQLERDRSMALRSIRFVPLIETARGAALLGEFVTAPVDRVQTLAYGPADFAADLGVALEPAGRVSEFISLQLVVTARAAGLHAPLEGPFMRVRDEEGLRADCARSRGLGFGGRLAIHPSQVTPIAESFGEAPADELAEKIVLEWSRRDPNTSSIVVEGMFVDEPVAVTAARQLAASNQLKSGASA